MPNILKVSFQKVLAIEIVSGSYQLKFRSQCVVEDGSAFIFIGPRSPKAFSMGVDCFT